ncbi:Thyroid adenoma-associated protein-like protein, partial [Gryllus bimaculatus]
TSAAAGGGDAEPLAPARLRTLLLCLCAARRHGAFDDVEDHGDEDDVDVAGSWKGVLSYELLLRCATHASDEVRLGALALAAEAHRSTEAPSRGELR